MLEPPSPELLKRLLDWQLCRPGDLRRARYIVRRLAHDLPAFDSVWIDALVQLGCLTPYQARILESSTPAALKCGEALILDELGRSAWGHTWFGRLPGDSAGVVIKQITPPRERHSGIVERGRVLVAEAARLESRQIVAPFRMTHDAVTCTFFSRFTPGLSLQELLVRRGRFPNAVVTELAYQLAGTLAEWHRGGQVHGDVRLSHVRIDPQGQTCLVEAGLRPVIEPEVTLHATLALEAYDGIAPELIGIGHQPTPSSDLYALGCLLWQLLAGRPPYPVADPLAKLAAHQTRPMDDICEWAPDTPTELAMLIGELTAHRPEQRPTAQIVVERLQHQPRCGRRGLHHFRQSFDAAVPHLRPTVTAAWTSWPAVLTGAAAIALVAALVVHPASRHELLSLGQTWWESRRDSASPTVAVQVDSTSGLLPLPPLSPDGTLLLTEAGPYAVGTLQHAGPVRVLAAPGVCPEIRVRTVPLRISAETLQIEGVRIKYDRLWKATETPRALVMVQAQHITLDRYEQDLGTADPATRSETIPIVGMAWRLVEPADPAAGTLKIQNSLFFGDGVGLFANQTCRQVSVENSLRMGQQAWFELVRGDWTPQMSWTLQHVTCRESGPVFRVRSVSDWAPRSMLVQCNQAVLGLETPTAALAEFDADDVPAEAFVWQGEATLIPVETVLARLVAGNVVMPPLATEDWVFEGLMAGRFRFAGPPTFAVNDSLLAETEIPRSSPELPGIQLQGWGACHSSVAAPDEPSLSLELP